MTTGLTKRSIKAMKEKGIGFGMAWVHTGFYHDGKPDMFLIQFTLGEDGKFHVGNMLLEDYLKSVENHYHKEKKEREEKSDR